MVIGTQKGREWYRTDVWCGAEILTRCWEQESYSVVDATNHNKMLGHSLTKREAWELFKQVNPRTPCVIMYCWDAGDSEASDSDEVIVWG